jgi:hypothetical protein
LSSLSKSWNAGYILMAAKPNKLAIQVVIPPARPATSGGYSSPTRPHGIRLNPMLANAWKMQGVTSYELQFHFVHSTTNRKCLVAFFRH